MLLSAGLVQAELWDLELRLMAKYERNNVLLVSNDDLQVKHCS